LKLPTKVLIIIGHYAVGGTHAFKDQPHPEGLRDAGQTPSWFLICRRTLETHADVIASHTHFRFNADSIGRADTLLKGLGLSVEALGKTKDITPI
jgi:hypothetical protein